MADTNLSAFMKEREIMDSRHEPRAKKPSTPLLDPLIQLMGKKIEPPPDSALGEAVSPGQT